MKNMIKTEAINGIRSDKKEAEKENKNKGNGAAATNGSTVKTEGSWGDSNSDEKKKSDVSFNVIFLKLVLSA